MMGVLMFAYYADCDPLTKGDVAASDQVIRARFKYMCIAVDVVLVAIISCYWFLLAGLANVFGR